MDFFRIAVPAGIGDVSWIWSKLSTLKNTKFQIFTPDTVPQRTFQWLHLLGDRVIPAIGKHGYNDILTRESLLDYESYTSWDKLVKKHQDGEVIYLQPNQWFLAGRRIEEWLPDLETNFHYPMFVQTQDVVDVKRFLRGVQDPIGIHMGSIRGAKAWNTWTPRDWATFLVILSKTYPMVTPVLLGGGWDLEMSLEVTKMLPASFKYIDLVGRTNIGQAVAVLMQSTYYVGFSSGLNVLCNVLRKPCTTLWPEHQAKHIYPHAETAMALDGSYIGLIYAQPEEVVRLIAPTLRKELDYVQIR